MKSYKFEGILTEDGWKCPAFVDCDRWGRIIQISDKEGSFFPVEIVDGYALPGIVNAHSHAFQYAMAGLAEGSKRPASASDFWTWRDAMYKIALAISPDQMQHIACQLYCEMLRHGYTHVVEFHYLHHDKSGKPYANISEMGNRLIAAAKTTGIKITLLPVLYQQGGFGQEASHEQRRFLSSDIDQYVQLYEAVEKACSGYEGANAGLSAHSLRAVNEKSLKELLEWWNGSIPFHIHVAEQLKEVEESTLYLGQRPVEWLANHVGLADNMHLIHCTHLNDHEIKILARSPSTVVLCPSTEGNLGDGFFPITKFMSEGGQWSIGTDSHIGLNPMEELRILDYGQRRLANSRVSFYSYGDLPPANAAIDSLFRAGWKAAGYKKFGYFQPDQDFDALIVSSDRPLIESTGKDNLLSTILYTCDVSDFKGTLVKGKWVVLRGVHSQGQAIREAFRKAVLKMGNGT